MLKVFIRLKRENGGIVDEYIPAILVLQDEAMDLIQKAEQFVDENKRADSISMGLLGIPGVDFKFLEEISPDLEGIEAIFAKTAPSYMSTEGGSITRAWANTSFGVVFDAGVLNIGYKCDPFFRVQEVKGQEYVFEDNFLDAYQPEDLKPMMDKDEHKAFKTEYER